MINTSICSKMNNLLTTTKQSNFQLCSQTLAFRSLQHKNPSFMFLPPGKFSPNVKVKFSCSATVSDSHSYGGWDYQPGARSIHSGDSNLLHSFLISLGINDKKYLVVYFLGFICALTIFRVKVSSIIALPACVLVFAVGFSVGFLNSGQIRWNATKKMTKDLNFKQFGEKFRDLIDDCHVKIVSLRNDVKKAVDYKQITYDDLGNILKAVELIDVSTMDARNAFEGYIESIVNENQEVERTATQKSIKKKKEVDEHGFNIGQFVFSLFQRKHNPTKMKDTPRKASINMDVNERKQGNILSSPSEDRRVDSLFSRYGEDRDGSLSGEMFANHSRMQSKNQNFTKTRSPATQVFESKTHGYQKRRSYHMNQELSWKIDRSKEVETKTSHSYDALHESMDLDANLKHQNTRLSYWQDQKTDDVKVEEHFESMEESHHHAFESYTRQQRMPFDSEPSLGDSESTEFSEDMEFNMCLSEAKSLLTEAKECIMQLRDDVVAENALYSSAKLLSKAVNIRPMSLIAIGQLGNTYLLHGELKLRLSRELRAVLARTDPVSGDEWDEVDENVGQRDKIISALVQVCAECEELLVEAGRKYKLALSIDGSDMRALYNWGLALFFRAQLISDIGPGAARDADKVFLAAIDKFDAMMSRSNLYAPDALLRWGAALQQRSRLRPRKSKEKVKLLQQARRLYQDALEMDSDNNQVKDALSSCVSELKHWYDYGGRGHGKYMGSESVY